MWRPMQFLTDFGDQAMILPLAAIFACAWGATGWRRGTWSWCLVVPATLGAVLLAKLSVIACGAYLPPWRLHSPSGHTASAALVYGGALGLLAPPPVRRLVVALAPVLVAVVVGATRVGLREHTLADAIAGGIIGVAGAWVLAAAAGPRPRLRPAALWVLAAAMLAIILFHGTRLNAEYRITEAARVIWPLTLCRR